MLVHSMVFTNTHKCCEVYDTYLSKIGQPVVLRFLSRKLDKGWVSPGTIGIYLSIIIISLLLWFFFFLEKVASFFLLFCPSQYVMDLCRELINRTIERTDTLRGEKYTRHSLVGNKVFIWYKNPFYSFSRQETRNTTQDKNIGPYSWCP